LYLHAPPTSNLSTLSLHDALPISYLTNTRINNCGLDAQAATNAAPTWTYATARNGCAGTLTLTIEREYAFQETVGTANINVISRSEEHMSELQSRFDLVCRLLLEK